MMKKGMKANTIHGNPSGGGGLDNKGKKANTIHGSASGGGGIDNKGKKANTIHGPSRESSAAPTKLTGKMNKRMF